MLAPTTVLAAQHQRVLQRRMPEFRIELLTGRMPPQSVKGKAVRRRIQEGEVDIIVGTHALLSKSVEFQNLGLLVVDEEQRFGVAQKDKMKAMATGIDVLTLSATPIPRTLQMSLSGIRDLSTLMTPPEGRKNVTTKVARFDEKVLQDCLGKEIERGGQAFYVVPRIAQIDESITLINRLLPTARVSVAHGRMNDIEDRIIEFTNGEADILVATSVIENGLDLPNANTIVVVEPQMFGLSELYQLRGRVGRSSRSAFAYFFYPANTSMTYDAVRRLSAIKELNALGSGFEVANRDLEIRGAGSIMGKKQSGMHAKVGMEVYMTLLQEAIDEAKGTEVASVPHCRLRIPAAKIILQRGFPESYLDEAGKIAALGQLEAARNPREVLAIGRGWREASNNQLPSQVEAMLKIYNLEALARRLGVIEVETNERDVLLHVPGWTPRVAELLTEQLQRGWGELAYSPSTRQVVLKEVGTASPAKQLAILLSTLANGFICLEGKENFGFS